MRWLIPILVASGCRDKAEAPAVASGALGSARDAVAAAPADGAAASTASPGTRREDLAKLPNPLAASIAVPLDARVVSESEPQRDRDGLTYKSPFVTVTGVGPAIKLSTDAALGWIPTTAEADLADNARRERPFGVAKQTTAQGGEWAIAYQWNAEGQDCFVRGWSPRAHVLCQTVELKIRCAEVGTVLDVCTSIEPSGAPVAPPSDPAAAFPKATDPKVAQVAATVARAVVRNDREALLGLVGPRGLVLRGKKLSRAALGKLLGGDTIQKAFDIDCTPPQGSRESACVWNSDDTGADGAFALLAHEGYGVIPQLVLARDKDGAWWLTKLDALDLGEP
jgi:hypothetical protein